MTDDLKNAERAIQFAQQVRRVHARRTPKDAKRRLDDIELGLTRLREAMAPVRSAISRARYEPQTEMSSARHTQLREVSLQIQSERRKLWKLRKRKNGE